MKKIIINIKLQPIKLDVDVKETLKAIGLALLFGVGMILVSAIVPVTHLILRKFGVCS